MIHTHTPIQTLIPAHPPHHMVSFEAQPQLQSLSAQQQLATQMAMAFDEAQLIELCAVASIDPAVLHGPDYKTCAERLVQYAYKHKSDLHALLTACQQTYSQIDWFSGQ